MINIPYKVPHENKILCKLEKREPVLPVVQGHIIGGIIKNKRREGEKRGKKIASASLH